MKSGEMAISLTDPVKVPIFTGAVASECASWKNCSLGFLNLEIIASISPMEVFGEKYPWRRTYPRSPGEINLLNSYTYFSTISTSSGNSVSRGLDLL